MAPPQQFTETSSGRNLRRMRSQSRDLWWLRIWSILFRGVHCIVMRYSMRAFRVLRYEKLIRGHVVAFLLTCWAFWVDLSVTYYDAEYHSKQGLNHMHCLDHGSYKGRKTRIYLQKRPDSCNCMKETSDISRALQGTRLSTITIKPWRVSAGCYWWDWGWSIVGNMEAIACIK